MTTATRVGTRPHVVFDRERLDARLVGGKLARLAVMAARDLSVPRFFCLTIDFFEEVLAPLRETVSRRLADVRFDEPAAVRRAAADVAALFEAIELTPGQRGEILAAFDAAFSTKTLVSVRASTVGRRLEESEDSADNAFAGMSDSFLCVPREQVIDRVISDIGQNPVRAEDLERVKTQLIAEAIYAQDNQATLARWYGAALTTGLSIEDIRSWPDRIRAVTSEQVRAAAQKWLDKKRSVTGYLIKDTTAKREEKRS